METGVARVVAGVRPRCAAGLRGWVRAVLGVEVPGRGVCAGHGSPLDYLEHVFFERGGDVVVWANRGGGKTFYGAVATLLDLLFKPGVEVRILGGSLDQSRKMYEHLRWMLERDALRGRVAGRMTERGVRLDNGSRVELLAQSQASVRGQRVQKLRCDEVELFDREVWSAAQFVTRSADCGGLKVSGTVEALSTMHRPFGLMSELVDEARSGVAGGWRLLRWCALDVMARCEPERPCDGCNLWEVCGGRAKGWRGFLPVEDVVAQARRGQSAFESEMLCRRPSRSDAVYPAFGPAAHVRAVEPDALRRWVGGMDFGMRSPFVMLWAQIGAAADGSLRVEVIDEYIESDRVVADHLRAIGARPWPRPAWLGVDPAGAQRSSHSGRTTIGLLREAGYTVRAARVALFEGIEAVRGLIEGAYGQGGMDMGGIASALRGHVQRSKSAHAHAEPRACHPESACHSERACDPGLLIHPRCERLIESLTCYHFDPRRPERREPVKDGHDHAADALRYLVVNLLGRSAGVRVERY